MQGVLYGLISLKSCTMSSFCRIHPKFGNDDPNVVWVKEKVNLVRKPKLIYFDLLRILQQWKFFFLGVFFSRLQFRFWFIMIWMKKSNSESHDYWKLEIVCQYSQRNWNYKTKSINLSEMLYSFFERNLYPAWLFRKQSAKIWIWWFASIFSQMMILFETMQYLRALADKKHQSWNSG